MSKAAKKKHRPSKNTLDDGTVLEVCDGIVHVRTHIFVHWRIHVYAQVFADGRRFQQNPDGCECELSLERV